jgi:FkbM family methyltransferase
VAAWKLGGDVRSRLRLLFDFTVGRVLDYLPARALGGVRSIKTHDGAQLFYRLNRGDLQGIREVWFDQAYRLPFSVRQGTLLDLGANIGLTSVWLARRYGFDRVVAVEPDRSNIVVLKRNLLVNRINAEVIEAAVGASDGTANFSAHIYSNQGHLAAEGIEVKLLSAKSVLDSAMVEQVELAKVDIEGSEQQLFFGPKDWLASVRSMIVEFHPPKVDYVGLIQAVEQSGLRYIPAQSIFPGNMDCFTRT